MTVLELGLRSFFKVYFPELYAKWLELPRAFCHKVQGPPLGPALLRGPSGNVWKVEVVEVDGARCFRGAWPAFVKDHGLRPGEFLVFEWDGRTSYDVVILDYSMCDKPSAFLASPTISSTVSVSVSVNGHSGVDELDSLGVYAGGIKVIAAAPSVGDGSQMSGKESGMNTPKPGPGRPKNNWPGTEQSTNASGLVKGKRIFLSQRRPVHKEEIDRAQRAAYSFKSSHPSIVLIMRKSAVYTGYMLNIPHLFARMHLSEVTDLVLKDSVGRHWPVNLVASKTGYFMSAGWRKFCIENHLEEYDACVFELIDPKTFLVHIFRVVEEITPTLMRRIQV